MDDPGKEGPIRRGFGGANRNRASARLGYMKVAILAGITRHAAQAYPQLKSKSRGYFQPSGRPRAPQNQRSDCEEIGQLENPRPQYDTAPKLDRIIVPGYGRRTSTFPPVPTPPIAQQQRAAASRRHPSSRTNRQAQLQDSLFHRTWCL